MLKRLFRRKDEDLPLVLRAQAGDVDAYRQLVEKYQDRLFRTAWRVVRNKQDAEDIVQDAFIKSYQQLNEFKGEASYSSWLYRIVLNLSIDHKRKYKRRGGDAVEIDDSMMVAPTHQSPAELLSQKEELGLVQRALDELSEDHRTVLILREVEGLSYEEIARVAGVSEGTVMSRLFYARKRLQESLVEVSKSPQGKGSIQKFKVGMV